MASVLNCSISFGSMSNSTTSPLASRFRLWWKARSQRLPRRSTLSTPSSAISPQICWAMRRRTCSAICSARPACGAISAMASRIRCRLRIGDALGEQQLQHCLQAGIGDARGNDLVDQAAIFRLEPIEQRAHVLVGKKLRQVVADDLAQMREHHRHVVDSREAVALEGARRTFPKPTAPSCRRRVRASRRPARWAARHRRR